MMRKDKKYDKKEEGEKPEKTRSSRLHPDTKKSAFAIAFLGIAIVLFLSSIGKAGPLGAVLFGALNNLFGWGFYLLPILMTVIAVVFLFSHEEKFIGFTLSGAAAFIVSGLGVIDIIFPQRGGLTGSVIGTIQVPFGYSAALVIGFTVMAASLLVTLNVPLKLRLPKREKREQDETLLIKTAETPAAQPIPQIAADESREETKKTPAAKIKKTAAPPIPKDYVMPTPSLLKAGIDKPSPGDLRANANIIKRTLDSFGIPVDMGEINVGPKVTRYTLKPAEGVKLSRITALNQDLSLALASHPIRIEAPIPGKSLVGIEVPNKSAALVRLGSLMSYPDFSNSGAISFALGRDVSGEPIFADISRMPHLLIAGATGSGKSVAIHALIASLLYKNSPATLRFVLIDPKRVELSAYEGIPHLVAPVITDAKKTVAVFRWAIAEMEKRYETLLKAGARDIQGYNTKNKTDHLPYILIIVDELADLMAQYGREVEGSIVRIAQMARATGIHLILSTQRPSVEVITGLIKANITSRVALQVASQVDSRTILDTAGAEKLLGGGDMLFVSSESSKPKRIQGAYISEEEIRKVADFIRDNNEWREPETLEFDADREATAADKYEGIFENYAGDDSEDPLYNEAVELVRDAKKASASLLQRRLKLGYARAARLLDIMEEKGIVGPGDGAKPREVYIKKIGN
ncbi:MAG: DUF87 domain-containing protein [Parcubacteria group bacterium]|nr:DUF87 domain-containing protein [Parcubacteria group bacterium]